MIYFIVSLALIVGAVAVLYWMSREVVARGRRHFSDPGVFVELDCRTCGQLNRVGARRLRDRPRCGRCKQRLLPGKKISICQVTELRGMDRQVTELRGMDRAGFLAVWSDENLLWAKIADYVATHRARREEAHLDQAG